MQGVLTGFRALAYSAADCSESRRPRCGELMDLELAEANQKLYVCPGETVPISRAVHLGRLSRGFPACDECPLNGDTGSCGARTQARLTRSRARRQGEVATAFGQVRGVYLNRMTRQVARGLVGQFAAGLWQHVRRAVKTHRREHIAPWEAPLVVIGYDSRPSSPDIVVGVQSQLRMMGCEVVDLGLCTGPALQYAVRLHRAVSGVFVSGWGHPPAWTGLDFFGADGQPCDVSELTIPKSSNPAPAAARPVRKSGTHRFQPIGSEFARRISRYVRPVRPLRICIGVDDVATRTHIEQLLAGLAESRWSVVDLPCRQRDLSDSEDPDVRRLGRFVVASGGDLGCLVADDARRIAIVDDEGELVQADLVAQILADDRVELAQGEELWSEVARLRESREPELAWSAGLYAFPSSSLPCDAGLALARFLTRLAEQPQSLAELSDCLKDAKVGRRSAA